ncbi:MAG: type II toxin-antitoxin system death-on-curing family toxin [Candidatus Omnitrophica bacterium]|nr:type II toxin-antitoxin system death-on-curing family toxin [Candidatus Omnitrophota bacterium]
MAKNRLTIEQLAQKAGIDSEDALIRLWDAPRFGKIQAQSDKIRGYDLEYAKKILGIATRDELVNPRYWQAHFDLSDQAFKILLEDLSIAISPHAKQLPRGAISKLKAESRRRITADYIFSKSQKIDYSEHSVSVKSEELEWKIIGHRREELRYLETEEVSGIHNALVGDFAKTEAPIIPSGCRNKHLLASAVFRPHTSNGGELKYPTVEMSAAALLHSLVHDHPFHNGNKRTALVSMLVFLDENGFLLTCNENVLFKFVLDVALHRVIPFSRIKHPDYETLAIAKWLSNNTRPIERGNHPIPFRKLRQILHVYGCIVEPSGGSGGRMNISRTVTESGFFHRGRDRTLRTQVYYGNEGREMGKGTINKIRCDLHLDEQHNVDAKAFYESAAIPVGDFIAIYRKTLDRLAKL